MVKLLILVIAPFILAFITVLIFFARGNNLCNKIKFSLTLHPELGLVKQGLLWLAILCPVYYFFSFGYFAWQDFNVDLTSVGFNEFITISILPLALLSLAIPLSVLVSRLHSTEQSAKQIEIVSYKNNLDTYRSHRQELFAYYEQIGETDFLDCVKVKFKIHPRLHRNFFNGSPKDGLPAPIEAAFNDIESELTTAKWGIDRVIRDVNKDMTLSFYLNACSALIRLSEKIGIQEIYIDLANKGVLVPVKLQKQPETESLLTIGTTTNELVAAYRIAKSYYINLCDFSGVSHKLQSSEEMKYIDLGVKFRTINEELVVEKLHRTTIKQAIELK